MAGIERSELDRRRSVELGRWHREWEECYLHRAEFRPEGRKEGSDYNQHYLDVNPPADAEKIFRDRADEIMGRGEDGPTRMPLPDPTPQERFLGSMLAGLAGDALGRDVAAGDVQLDRRGERDPGAIDPPLGGRTGRVSSASEMSSFVLEGLIRAHVARRIEPRDNDPVPEIQLALQRWLHAYGQPWAQSVRLSQPQQPDGWLITNPELFVGRAPDDTSLRALRHFVSTGVQAGFQNRINEATGPGALLRAAPVAVWSNDPAEVFNAATRIAALTHGAPSGYLSAGVLAVVLHQMLRGEKPDAALDRGRELLIRCQGNEETLFLLDKAISLKDQHIVSSAKINEEFGFGRTAAEVLAIGAYVAMDSSWIREALLLGSNHDGDTAATAQVAGIIAGAFFGSRAVPQDLVDPLELHDVTRILAQDALVEFSPNPPTDPYWTQRYPGW